MAPHRLVFFLTAAIGLPTLLTFFSLLHSHPGGKLASEDEPKSGLRAFFSFHAPSSLFPPSAIISLTDDNSTFFLSRPADFGPSLPSNGLGGQLWIGSGFGEDDLGRSGVGSGAEGELGCSDVPGWNDKFQKLATANSKEKDGFSQNSVQTAQNDHTPDSTAAKMTRSEDNGSAEPSIEDGTDDHLHHPLPSSPVSKPLEPAESTHYEQDRTGHADIQSLQEAAEIAGKIVLLSRGGCGFLEKVKWAQRRGATALIVGDHTRGGALVTMYAHGDTSNVTIPSVFTSHTTVHLLSSLIPPEDKEDSSSTFQTIAGSVFAGKGNEDVNMKTEREQLEFTQSSSRKAASLSRKSRLRRRFTGKPIKTRTNSESGWLSSVTRLFRARKRDQDNGLHSDSRRPPSSGRLDPFADKNKGEQATDSKRSTKMITSVRSASTSKANTKGGAHPGSGDDFVIGVQDWRDPDLVIARSSNTKSISTPATQSLLPTQVPPGRTANEAPSNQQPSSALSGGSITPGSGEYQNPNVGEKEVDKESSKPSTNSQPKSNYEGQDAEEEHEGLWVTLTPTTMSTSPFFDTLLVLVVSPLVTLTVVYALLLLRSRIRRRRWRAPKSVVERLPVRTYHTMSGTSTPSSVCYVPSQSSSPASPLLQSSPRSAGNQKRPRSATASGIGDAASASLDRATAKASILQNGKVLTTSPKKRKKYHARQVECVVCLEEYVDGHSRIMSLPCGHEFHADCM